MQPDILIFAVIAAFLVYRLNSLLGTRHGDERARPNPFADNAGAANPARAAITPPAAALPAARRVIPMTPTADLIDPAADKDGRVATGLIEIAAADPRFEVNSFMEGARYAFLMVVEAYAKGDIAALKPMLSPRLYSDFAGNVALRQSEGRTSEVIVHRVKSAKLAEASLGGVMAYITVAYSVEETVVTRDRDGKVVDGDPDRIVTIDDLWTFTRDIRAADPNWTLIETKAVEK